MKNLILTLLAILVLSLGGFAQVLIHEDILTINGSENKTYSWYFEHYNGTRYNPRFLKTEVGLIKRLSLTDTTHNSVMYHYTFTFSEGDTITSPYNGNEYSYEFVRDYIFSTDEAWLDTLANWQLQNWGKRLLE